jgi:peptidoglycan-associated lipoprotein
MKQELLAVSSAAVLCIALASCAKNSVAVARPPQPPAAAPNSTPAPAAYEAARASSPAPAVKEAASNMPDAATRARIQDLINRIQDAYFDYNKHTLRPDAQSTLQADAKTLSEILQQYPSFKLTVEGHCDERGSDEYNMSLGDARAQQAKDYLVNLGLPGQQLNVVSFGKENPVCTEHDEECWKKNRRAHISDVAQKS